MKKDQRPEPPYLTEFNQAVESWPEADRERFYRVLKEATAGGNVDSHKAGIMYDLCINNGMTKTNQFVRSLYILSTPINLFKNPKSNNNE